MAVICFFPEYTLPFFNQKWERVKIITIKKMYFFKYFFALLSICLLTIGYLLKKNNKKRNTIYALAQLLDETQRTNKK